MTHSDDDRDPPERSIEPPDEQKFLATTIIGVPYLIIFVEVLCLVIFFAFRSGISGEQTASVGSW
ncbi:MAG TPA: hypothetical protein VHL58_20395 [Thermoanaerobaculia bacterium]|nr:hypothetical protein [Thermoanaerobaculia bacterium]